MHYKRNQVEEAIVRTLGAEGARVDQLKLKMKRLLVTDRRLGRGKRSDYKVGRRYAFYSQQPQGSGVEVMFSDYEAFALLAALLVLEHGIPQAKVVSILQEIRSDFKSAHRHTLQRDPTLKHKGLPVIAVKPEGDKRTRLLREIAKFANAQVFLLKTAPGRADLETELFNFPGGQRNDLVDALSQALSYKHVPPNLWTPKALENYEKFLFGSGFGRR